MPSILPDSGCESLYLIFVAIYHDSLLVPALRSSIPCVKGPVSDVWHMNRPLERKSRARGDQAIAGYPLPRTRRYRYESIGSKCFSAKAMSQEHPGCCIVFIPVFAPSACRSIPWPMPPDPSSSRKTRTKTGCLVCRARRVRCDEDRPKCRKCVKYMADCVYPEEKAFDPRENRIALDRRHRTSRSRSQDAVILSRRERKLSPPQLTEEQRMAQQTAYIHAICRNTRMSSFFTSPQSPPDFLRAEFTSEAELEAVHHALSYTLSIIVVDEQNNQFVWLAPLFLLPSSEAPLGRRALRYAMMALGATHLAS